MPVFIAEFLEILGPWLTRLAIAHAATTFIKILASVGIAIFAYTQVIKPFIDHIETAMQGLPGNIAAWCGALGIDKACSILIGAYTISATRRLFFGKTST